MHTRLGMAINNRLLDHSNNWLFACMEKQAKDYESGRAATWVVFMRSMQDLQHQLSAVKEEEEEEAQHSSVSLSNY